MDDALFEQLTAGLKEGIEHVRGERELRETVFPSPPPAVTADRVRQVRESVSMSQSKFARVLGVSVKTVQSWEQDGRTPAPIACRMIELLEKQPSAVLQSVGLGGARAAVPAGGRKPRRPSAGTASQDSQKAMRRVGKLGVKELGARKSGSSAKKGAKSGR